MEDQHNNKCLHSLPKVNGRGYTVNGWVYDLINKVVNGEYENMLDTVDNYKFDLTHSENSEHTEEDTLKLTEATSRCLKHEMSKYLSASWKTFGKRQVLAVQCVNNTITLMCSKRVEGNKWCFVEQRSTIVPRDSKKNMVCDASMVDMLVDEEMLGGAGA
ncbi:hypothetical protein INT47_004295 [Mucor saturninus]|uniref:Uncharacterized protein n=1 Tax=Mucor saturninus TaxID=64648 RepID=A0A8H7V552_9FUNG|nr:hypothetical protein INT47_004295 [Mucor saturninus]